jgi:hypothetical protein
LADQHRRSILSHLRETDDGVSTANELVAHVTAQNGRMDEEAVATSFHHTHVPKLVDAGLIAYDERSDTVRYLGNTFVERCLTTTTESETG